MKTFKNLIPAFVFFAVALQAHDASAHNWGHRHHSMHSGYSANSNAEATRQGITTGACLAYTTCRAGERKAGTNLEMARDQVAEHLINQRDSALLREAMETFRAELVKDNPEAQGYDF